MTEICELQALIKRIFIPSANMLQILVTGPNKYQFLRKVLAGAILKVEPAIGVKVFRSTIVAPNEPSVELILWDFGKRVL